MSEENKAVVRRLIAEVINEHDPNAAERFFTADFVEHIPASGQEQGLEGMRRWLEEVYFRAFPDVHWSAEEQVEVWGMVLDRIVDGKVVESRILHDTVSMLQQMGAMAPPDQSEGASPT